MFYYVFDLCYLPSSFNSKSDRLYRLACCYLWMPFVCVYSLFGFSLVHISTIEQKKTGQTVTRDSERKLNSYSAHPSVNCKGSIMGTMTFRFNSNSELREQSKAKQSWAKRKEWGRNNWDTWEQWKSKYTHTSHAMYVSMTVATAIKAVYILWSGQFNGFHSWAYQLKVKFKWMF